MKLILIFGLWINPANISALWDTSSGCFVRFMGDEGTTIDDVPCKEVAAAINAAR